MTNHANPDPQSRAENEGLDFGFFRAGSGLPCTVSASCLDQPGSHSLEFRGLCGVVRRRAPDYFDTILAGKSAKEYGVHCVTRFQDH